MALTIGIVAPSGALGETALLDRAVRFLESQGLRVVSPEAVRAKYQRFAGPDELRLSALHELARRDDVDIVMAARGGYGLSRLLDRIDYELLATSKKIFVGHSDFSALQLALLARTQTCSFAGPNAAFDFGAEVVSDYTSRHFFGILNAPEFEISVRANNPHELGCEGTIWGGNLALVAALAGTAYLPRIDSGILFLEDVNEHPYRIERMLYQLFHAGILQRQQAVLLGDFSGYELYTNDNGYDLSQVIVHFRERLRVPLLTGLPFGHIRDKITIPVGGKCRLEVRREAFSLRFSGYPLPAGRAATYSP